LRPSLWLWNNSARTKEFFDFIYTASQSIRTIDPDDKGSNDHILEAAKRAIADADCLYILGYGFDGNNNKRLGLNRHCLSTEDPMPIGRAPTGVNKCVMFTNYGDRNQVNKKVSNLFLNRHDAFLTPGPVVHGDPTGMYYIEKSVRDVYGALEVDFDDLETQRLFDGTARRT